MSSGSVRSRAVILGALSVVIGVGTGLIATRTTPAPRVAGWKGGPTWARDGSRVAWGGGGRIWVARADGSERSPITGRIDALGGIRWMNDGRLLYWANYRLFTIRPGDRRARKLADVAGDGVGSTDALGRTLAYDWGDQFDLGGDVVDTASGSTVWTFGDRHHIGSPSLAPAGDAVVFADPRTGMFIEPRPGGSRRLLTRRGSCPIWSPDGTRVAFERDGRLAVIPASGGAIREIAPGLEREERWCTALEWAPDGTMLAAADEGGSLFIVAPDDRARRLPLPAAVNEIAWSPDGRTLLVTAGDRDCSTVWLVDVNGSDRPHRIRNCTAGG